MKRITGLMIVCLLAACACAEPLEMAADLADTVKVEIGGGAEYIYTYTYPQVDEEDPSAELINSFYQYKVSDAVDFEIPMNADYYISQGTEENVTVDISYQVTCNNDDYFSVLIRTAQGEFVTWTGHVFSRKDIKPGSSVALPYLLGVLESEETDTWLQDRQTAKADALVREMVWEALEDSDIEVYEDFEEESLEYGFFPEEDFYLDETGNPVFYLEPGFADGSGELLTFPITIEDILDEM